MREDIPRRLHGTSVYLAGTKVDLGNEETIKWLQAEKIKKVFCLYPLTQKQFGMLPEPAKRGASTIDFFYRGWRIYPMFVAKLAMKGGRVSSIWRSPDQFRGNTSFFKRGGRSNQRGKTGASSSALPESTQAGHMQCTTWPMPPT